VTGPSDVPAIIATDDELRDHLAEAGGPPLLSPVAYVAGDLSLLRDALRPNPSRIAQNRPFTLLEYWRQRSLAPDPDDDVVS
jgi:hypothetical protein